MSNAEDIIYLDYAATTPADPRVIDVMTPLLGAQGDFGNPSSGHRAGRRSMAHVERAAEQLAALLGCTESEVVFRTAMHR